MKANGPDINPPFYLSSLGSTWRAIKIVSIAPEIQLGNVVLIQSVILSCNQRGLIFSGNFRILI